MKIRITFSISHFYKTYQPLSHLRRYCSKYYYSSLLSSIQMWEYRLLSYCLLFSLSLVFSRFVFLFLSTYFLTFYSCFCSFSCNERVIILARILIGSSNVVVIAQGTDCVASATTEQPVRNYTRGCWR